MRPRVVITGIGLVTPIGIGVGEFWQACVQGLSGIDRITNFDPSEFSTQIGAELKNFNPSDYLKPGSPEGLEPVHKMGLVAAILAVDDSGIDLKSMNRERVTTCAGSGSATRLVSEERMTAIYHFEKGKRDIPLPQAITLGDNIAEFYEIEGPTLTFSNACATGNHSIGWASNLIRLGRAEVAIAGAAEAPITPLTTAGFCAMRAMSRRNDDPQRASRPFDGERDGFVLGEGACFLILETLEHARKRSASIYAEITGYSMTGEAYHMALPDPEANEIVEAMRLALQDAAVNTDDVDYINAHGSSTSKNDLGETLAIKSLFGHQAYNIPISSTKSMVGHSIGASGCIELAVCALAIRDRIIPPTINYEVPDPDCDLDYVPNEARKRTVKVALSNSFGFGGNDTSIVLQKLS